MFNPFRLLFNYVVDRIPVARTYGGYTVWGGRFSVQVGYASDPTRIIAEDGERCHATLGRRYLMLSSIARRAAVEITEAWLTGWIDRVDGEHPHRFFLGSAGGVRLEDFALWHVPVYERVLGPLYFAITSGARDDAGLAAYRAEVARRARCAMMKDGFRCEKDAGHEGDVHRIRDAGGTVGLFSADEADHGLTSTGVAANPVGGDVG